MCYQWTRLAHIKMYLEGLQRPNHIHCYCSRAFIDDRVLSKKGLYEGCEDEEDADDTFFGTEPEECLESGEQEQNQSEDDISEGEDVDELGAVGGDVEDPAYAMGDCGAMGPAQPDDHGLLPAEAEMLMAMGLPTSFGGKPRLGKEKKKGRNRPRREQSASAYININQDENEDPYTTDPQDVDTGDKYCINDAGLDVEDNDPDDQGEMTSPFPDELDTEWQEYWAGVGEQLVWQGWLDKYPDYIDPSLLNGDAIPTTNEVEVTISSTSDYEIIAYEVEDGSAYSCSPDDFPPPKNRVPSFQIGTTDSSDSDSAKLTHRKNSKSKLKYPSDAMNRAIEATMKLLEETSSDTDLSISDRENPARENALNQASEKNVETINMMHDYCAPATNPSKDQIDSQEIHLSSSYSDSNGVGHAETEEEEENYDDQWQALWDEHYMETYWYYYNQYKLTRAGNQTEDSNHATDGGGGNPDEELTQKVDQLKLSDISEEEAAGGLLVPALESLSLDHEEEVTTEEGGEEPEDGGSRKRRRSKGKSKQGGGSSGAGGGPSGSHVPVSGQPGRLCSGDGGEEPPDDRPVHIPKSHEVTSEDQDEEEDKSSEATAKKKKVPTGTLR